MVNNQRLRILAAVLVATLWLASVFPAQAQQPVVHVILFWMEGCPNCHEVIDNVLPPLQSKYGAGLDVLLVEVVSKDDIDRLLATAEVYGYGRDQIGVPFMIVGEHAMIGSGQIPAELPGLIDKYLAEGGLDFPALPELEGVIPTQPGVAQTSPPTEAPPTETRTPQTATPTTQEPTMTVEPVMTEEPAATNVSLTTTPPKSNGFTLASLIMLGMLASLAYSGTRYVRGWQVETTPSRPVWLEYATPLLASLGLGVAIYMGYIETTSSNAFCGPFGDCNAVQSSRYASLFGVLPVGVFGIIGYSLILLAWVAGRLKLGWLSQNASLAIFGMTLFGTLFSIYLTYLELFVIKAVCLWCLSSAVIIVLLMLANLEAGLRRLVVDE
jgi:uncharacterized membrane protein